MHRFAFIALIAAAPVSGQVAAPVDSAQPQPWGNPAADYITLGQDEPGYRNWYVASPAHRIAVASFNNYLATWEVSGIVPTWQLLRTATSWHKCGAQPFEVPPVSEWPHVVQTLRYIHDYVVPAVGPVEAVSAYRNPALNICAGGAPESAHKHYSAVDLVPLRETTREQLMHTLCAVHARRGLPYDVGLGFYAFLRFHVDTTKYRRWGADPAVASCPPIVRPVDVVTVAAPPSETAPAATAATPISGPSPAMATPVLGASPATAIPILEAAPGTPALPPSPDQAAGQPPQPR